MSIVRDIQSNEIRILTDQGRVQRPCFIVENNRLKITKHDVKMILEEKFFYKDLIERGCIENLDVEEEESAMIAMVLKDLTSEKSQFYSFTHCEIHPSMVLSVCASIIPFPDHN